MAETADFLAFTFPTSFFLDPVPLLPPATDCFFHGFLPYSRIRIVVYSGNLVLHRKDVSQPDLVNI